MYTDKLVLSNYIVVSNSEKERARPDITKLIVLKTGLYIFSFTVIHPIINDIIAITVASNHTLEVYVQASCFNSVGMFLTAYNLGINQ